MANKDLVVKLTINSKDFESGLKNAKASLGKLDVSVKSLGSNLTKMAASAAASFASVAVVAKGLKDAFDTITKFEQANANLSSILGATSDQMVLLQKSAIQLGSSTRYSSSQVTGLQTELAKLGFTVKEITDMSRPVLNFAGSVGTDLASAASLAGVALRSFGLDSSKTEDALGTLAVACNKSALSFEYLQNSFSTIAPVAKTYGLSLKDTIALLGTLANAGFDASSAATATRNILLKLSDTNGKLARALGGSVHSFDDIITAMIKLRDQGVDLNQTLELTDKRSVAAFNTFLDGAENARILRGDLEDVDGELQKIADIRANTVEGAIDGMKSAWEGLVLSFRNSTGVFSKVFKTITQSINGMRDIIDPEGSIEERTKSLYMGIFSEIGNEFISVEETRARIWQKYQELEQSIRSGGGGVVYKKHALIGLKKAYNEMQPELLQMQEDANKKVLELNEKFLKKEQEILKQQANLTQNGLNASNMAAYEKLQKQLDDNRKAWNQAVQDATRFKKNMDEVMDEGTPVTFEPSTSGPSKSVAPTMTADQIMEYLKFKLQNDILNDDRAKDSQLVEIEVLDEDIVEKQTDTLVESLIIAREQMAGLAAETQLALTAASQLGGAFSTMGQIADGTLGNIFTMLGQMIGQIVQTISVMMTLAGAETVAGVADLFANTKGELFTKLAVASAGLAGILGIIASAKSAFAGSFAEGGIVGGNSYTGDRLWARVNSGEMILNQSQQAALFAGGGQVRFVIEGSQLKGVLDNYETIQNL